MNRTLAPSRSRVQFRGPCSRILTSGLLAVDAVDFRVLDPSLSSPARLFISLSEHTPLLTTATVISNAPRMPCFAC